VLPGLWKDFSAGFGQEIRLQGKKNSGQNSYFARYCLIFKQTDFNVLKIKKFLGHQGINL
jgi:hypothetical protein